MSHLHLYAGASVASAGEQSPNIMKLLTCTGVRRKCCRNERSSQ